MFEMNTAPLGKQVIVIAAALPNPQVFEKDIILGQFMGVKEESGRWYSVGGYNGVGFPMELIPVRWGLTMCSPSPSDMVELKKITVDDFKREFYWR